MACPRCRWSGNMLVISASVHGASVAPADAQQRPRDDQHQRADANAATADSTAKAVAADQQQPPAADPVAERAHRDDEARHREAVAVADPQLLDAAGPQAGTEPRQRQQQRRQVHRDQQCRQHEEGQRQPCPVDSHRVKLLSVRCPRRLVGAAGRFLTPRAPGNSGQPSRTAGCQDGGGGSDYRAKGPPGPRTTRSTTCSS